MSAKPDAKAANATPVAPAPDSARRPLIVHVVTRIPATLALVVAILIVGVISQGLWRPVEDQPWFESIAYGLPAFEAGRWWTPITGTFFVVQPWVFIPTILAFWGMAFLEWKRGWRVALTYYWLGQLFAIFATAAFLMFARLLPWPWAVTLAQQVDVGASGGAMACIAAAVGLFVAPWRQRGWIIVFAYASISLLFLGTLADVEHAFAILLVLGIDRSFRVRRTTTREQRLLAFIGVIGLGAIQILTILLPTNGPFGPTDPLDGPWIDVAIDTVVIVFIARGLRLGRWWAWILALVLSILNMLTATVLFGIVLVFDPEELLDAIGDTDVTLATSAMWFAYFVFLLATRRAFLGRKRHPLARDTPTAPDEVKALIRSAGGGNLSWMTTWDGMEYFHTSTGIVPYQKHLGVTIVLADPLGASAGVAESVEEFITAAEGQGLIPCFFSASQITRDAVPAGWRALVVADDTIVDLAGLTFQGKAWARVRQSFSRGERDGMTFRLTTMAAEPWGVRQQLRAISESWVGDKGLPEMRFTLGTLEEAEDPEVRLALAISPTGDVDGFLSWLPVFGPEGAHRGWTLDLMRRRDGGFPVVMEFLIGSSAKAFAEEGADILSLSGAPLAHESEPEAGAIATLMGQLGAALEPVYGFRSLHQFKAKFNPRYEPIYLLYRDEGDLTRIAAALTRAFLPDASVRQFAAAGVDLIRGDRD